MSDILGFIAIDTVTEEIVISVRGSSSIYNWIADVVWARQETDLCKNCCRYPVAFAHISTLLYFRMRPNFYASEWKH